MSETIEIRRMTANDAAAVAALATELGYASEAAQMHARMDGILRREDHAAFVAARDGRILGWGHAYVCRLLETDIFVEVGGLVVSESARNSGIGTRLIDALSSWAGSQGCAEVRLRSNIVRKEAHAFYRNRGFSECKTQLTFARQVR